MRTILEHSTSEMLVNMSTNTLEEFYPAVAIGTLMRIIRDPSLSQHHTMVVQAHHLHIQKSGHQVCTLHLTSDAAYLNVIRTSDATFREVGNVYLEQS